MTYFTEFVQSYSWFITLISDHSYIVNYIRDLLDRGRSKSHHLLVRTGHRTPHTSTRWHILEFPWVRQKTIMGARKNKDRWNREHMDVKSKKP